MTSLPVNKIILHLCADIGSDSKPYKDAGYDVRLVGSDIGVENFTPPKVVCLIVSSTDRSYWHDIIFPYAAQIRFIRGRLKFGGVKSTAPFASAIVIFDESQKFTDHKDYRKRIRFYPCPIPSES